MIQPEKIIEQAQQGALPETWRVFHGKGRSVLSTILLSIFISVLATVCGSPCATYASLADFLDEFRLLLPAENNFPSFILIYPEPSSPRAGGYHLFLQTGGLVVLVAVLIGTAFAVIDYSQNRRMLNSLLVITPEGVVECEYYQRPQRRKWKVLDFSMISSLKLQLTGSRSSTSFWLDVQQRDGTWTRWPLDARFDRPEAIAQYIIEAQAHFVL
ncbi:hypothetical protein ccbrp13_39130 [Ktedonobacteria bacterium brp13]|nr:hypothetical protein ccbrp13_39130 [Ktedonobacteria bacterium brp13]